ncbi:uncharacterized protein LOC103515011 [Diaphorina citri]|uniref:Uncharacterized protein LOC103515011 n=1 Tax=Diaphorina citri TaxID=121845 RepID=A0A1S3DAW7_DIACI|nr:uncharacterized protein LOC103515011 [Diaphorina citri]
MKSRFIVMVVCLMMCSSVLASFGPSRLTSRVSSIPKEKVQLNLPQLPNNFLQKQPGMPAVGSEPGLLAKLQPVVIMMIQRVQQAVRETIKEMIANILNLIPMNYKLSALKIFTDLQTLLTKLPNVHSKKNEAARQSAAPNKRAGDIEDEDNETDELSADDENNVDGDEDDTEEN